MKTTDEQNTRKPAPVSQPSSGESSAVAPSSSVATTPVVPPAPTPTPAPVAPEEPGPKDHVTKRRAPAPPHNTPAPKPAPTTAPAEPADKPAKESRESTPLKHRVTVSTSTHYACSTKDHKESVLVASETHAARITIAGQGPCPGEIKDWTAEVSESRISVHGTHGTPAKCTCAGSGDMVIRGLDPGTYDVNVNGGFNRPIAVRVVVSP